MTTENNEVSEFIKTTIEGIRGGEDDDCSLVSNVEFELSVVVKKEGKGKFDIAIVGAGGNMRRKQYQK